MQLRLLLAYSTQFRPMAWHATASIRVAYQIIDEMITCALLILRRQQRMGIHLWCPSGYLHFIAEVSSRLCRHKALS